MKKILITGGTGFVGSHLVSALQQSGENILHLTSSHESSILGVQVHQLDLRNAAAVAKLIQDHQFTEIYHLASLSRVGESFREPATVLSNNFNLTLNLLESIRLYSSHSKTLLISSADIYDKNSDLPIDEKRLINPSNPYAASKAAQDLLGQTYAQSYQLPIIIARPFNHIGPGQGRGFVVADFAASLARAEIDQKSNKILVGNLTAARDFTDARDIVAAYQLLMSQGNIGEIYNLASGTTHTIQEVLDELVKLAHVPVTIISDSSKFRPNDHAIIAANIQKIRALGWEPQIRFTQTLQDIFSYWRGIIKTTQK